MFSSYRLDGVYVRQCHRQQPSSGTGERVRDIVALLRRDAIVPSLLRGLPGRGGREGFVGRGCGDSVGHDGGAAGTDGVNRSNRRVV